MFRPFKGGVHPDYMKSPEIPLTVIAPPEQSIVPMAQHIGPPCKPLVGVGDYVKMGQKIGDNDAPLSVPIHSPVSGKVVAIEPRRHPLGDKILSVVIENDGLDTAEFMQPLSEDELSDPEAILQRIREAGIVGLGGAMFPTAFKIRSGIGKVDKLIINGAECEPYLNGDHLTMLNYPEQLLRGIELARTASRLDTAYYGIETNKQDAIDLLNSFHPENYGVTIVPEKPIYPQGAERMQVKTVTGREVKFGGIPSSVGCNVISTRTCYAIYQACCEGRPLTERIITAAGSALRAPVNAVVRFGTPLGYIAGQCGGFVKTPKKLVLGGPMMGICASGLDVPTIKGTAGVLFFTEEEDGHQENPECLRCGKCLEVCPMRLEPTFMYMYFTKGNYEMMEKLHVLNCFECGSCSYNCPAGLPLTHSFKTAKLALKAIQQKKEQGQKSQQKEAEK